MPPLDGRANWPGRIRRKATSMALRRLEPGHEAWMRRAIDAARAGATPFGCVIIGESGELVAAHNRVRTDGDPTAHAELLAVRRLRIERPQVDPRGCTLFTTCEPCPMCAGAIAWCGLGAVIYGASIAEAAAFVPQIAMPCTTVLNAAPQSIHVSGGCMRESCLALFEQPSA